MPQLNREMRPQQPKPVEIPPKVLENLLKSNPENFDRVLSTLAGFAIKEGTRVMKELDQVYAKLPDNSPHKAKAENLKTEAIAAKEGLKTDLKKQDVKPSQAPEKEVKNAWTPDMVKKLQDKLEAKKANQKKEKKVAAAIERGHEIAELMRVNLLPVEAELKNLETKIKPANLDRDQKDEITNLTSQIDQQLTAMKLTNKERSEIIKQLPSYKNLKIANLRDDIITIDASISRMEKADKADQVISGFYKRIPKLSKDKKAKIAEIKNLAA